MTFLKDNGILAKMPGDVIGSASRTLPPPGDGQPAEAKVVVDAGDRGMVRITYELSSHRHGKARMWSWKAVFAEAVGRE